MRLKNRFSLATSCLLATLAFNTPTASVQHQQAKPSKNDFLISGKSVSVPQAPEVRVSSGPVPTYDWIRFSLWECKVEWDQHCDSIELFEAPSGWQACKFLYVESGRGGWETRFEITPTNWYTNDPESPDRFRAYSVKIGATGSGNVFNRVSAWITLNNVGIRLIPAWANNPQRYEAGCHMPAHD